MSNKYLKPDVSPQSPNGLYRADTPDNFELPSCGIEDVDRAVFKLFDEQIPLFFKSKENTKRIPVIFATGERAFILRRQKPLTDRHGALILPLVSILRSGLEQAPTAGGFGSVFQKCLDCPKIFQDLRSLTLHRISKHNYQWVL